MMFRKVLLITLAIVALDEHIYAAVSNFPDGMQNYRSGDGKNWELVAEPGVDYDPFYFVSWDMKAYRGQLYVSAHDMSSYLVPGIVLRSRDGTSWESVFTTAEGEPLVGLGKMPAGFGEFNGMLYMAVDVWGGWTESELWRSPSGDPGTWEMVLTLANGGFGSPLVQFNDYAYISGWKNEGGMFIYRSKDGLNCEQTGAEPLDTVGLNDGSLQVFKSQLYISIDTAKGGGVYRTKDGLTWEAVVTDGFNGPEWYDINCLIAYGGIFTRWAPQIMATALQLRASIAAIRATQGNGCWYRPTAGE
jgi:hypothetical protein